MEEGAVEGHGLPAFQFTVFIEGIIGFGVVRHHQLFLDLVELGQVALVQGECSSNWLSLNPFMTPPFRWS